MPVSSPLHVVYSRRDSLWSQVTRTGLRHTRPGRPRPPVDADAVERFGPFWREFAVDRKLRAAAKIVKLQTTSAQLDGTGGGSTTTRFTIPSGRRIGFTLRQRESAAS
jgi:hypothetical protein